MTYENALRRELHSCPELIDLIQEVGFLPCWRVASEALRPKT